MELTKTSRPLTNIAAAYEIDIYSILRSSMHGTHKPIVVHCFAMKP